MRRTVSLIIAVLAASPAFATPPQVVSVDEKLISIGGGYLFILRELNDNMGSHHLTQTDTVLIARSRETNQDMYVWPVSRTLDKGPEHKDAAGDLRLETIPVDYKYDPYQIAYTMHGGHPNQQKADSGSAVEIVTNSDGALISAKTPHFAYEPPADTPLRTSYWVNYTKITQQIERSLSETRYYFPAHFIEDGDPLKRPEIDFKRDCAFDYFAQLSIQTDGEQQATWATKVICENENTMAPISMFITLQPLP